MANKNSNSISHNGNYKLDNHRQKSLSTSIQNSKDHQITSAHHDHHPSSNHTSFYLLTLLTLFLLIGWKLRKSKPKDLAGRIDLLKTPRAQKIVQSKYFSFLLRLVPAILFVTVILTGLFGRERASLAAPFTWLIWWTSLAFLVAFGGKIFCAACPWDFFANLFQFNWFFPRKLKLTSLNLKWPNILSNIYLSVFMFIVITWLELAAGVVYNSYTTALMGLTIVGLAIVFALVFRKRAFCRYVCPIGRISGIYAQFSPLELRTRDPQICIDCRSKECVRGTTTSSPCPTGLVPYKLKQNTYCTLCTECIRSCPDNNLTLKLRPPTVDLYQKNMERKDEITLALVILILTFLHGLTMVPTWYSWIDFLERNYAITATAASSLIMGGIISISFAAFKLIFYLLDKKVTATGLNEKFIYAFIPLVLGYHVGHNAMHFFGEGLFILPIINDPFGVGWNIFGLKHYQPGPIFTHIQLQGLQLLCLVIGFSYSIKILKFKINTLCWTDNKAMTNKNFLYIGQYTLLLCVAMLGVWFIFQPMAMRGNY